MGLLLPSADSIPLQCGVAVTGQLRRVLFSYDLPIFNRLMVPKSLPTLGGALITALGANFGDDFCVFS